MFGQSWSRIKTSPNNWEGRGWSLNFEGCNYMYGVKLECWKMLSQ